MIKGFKVMLKPNNKQQTKLFQYAGTARFAYNWTLQKQIENYTLKGTGKSGGKFISDGVLRKEFTQLKKLEKYKWLNNISNNVTKQAIKDACNAYKRFFKGESKFPKFKSKKKSDPTFYQDTEKIKFTDSHVKLEGFALNKKKNKQKLNWVRLAESDRIPYGSNIKYINPRISFDGLNWFISLGIEVENIKPDLSNENIGIDLGIKNLAVVSNIDKSFKNINKTSKVKKIKKRLKRLQRQISRKYEMNKSDEKYIKTNNIIKLEYKANKLQKHLNNIRLDYRHKITTEIVKTKPSRIVVEDLNVSGMMKNRHLAKAVQEQSFYEMLKMLEYKSNKSGIEFVKADRFFPSSKTCSNCGDIKQNLSLSERIYTCEKCGFEIDRDKNASINLSKYKVS